MTAETDHAAFYEGRRSSVLPLVVGDCVMVVSGRRRGFGGVVVAVEGDMSGAAYLVEFGDGSMESIQMSNLSLDASGQRKCLFAERIEKGAEEFFIAIYAVASGFELVTSERNGADTVIPLSQTDVDKLVEALKSKKKSGEPGATDNPGNAQ